MSYYEFFPKNLVKKEFNLPPRPRFSLTSDIMSFRKCKRQYGYFGQDGFVPARAVQIYFGQIIHQVLDRCHRHYSGMFGHTKGTMPTDNDIEFYFDEVDNALSAHGVRPASSHVREQAKKVLKNFNSLEGPSLYPRVIDTEYRLESERDNFVLRGVVDVIASDVSGEPEIWDYKGSDKPALSSSEMKDLEWQMSVYAELYKAKSGRYPVRAILYFLNELKTNSGKRPVTAIHEVNFLRDGSNSDGIPNLVKEGLAVFDLTAAEIMRCKRSHQWDPPEKVDTQELMKTCDICDIRWNCPSHEYKIRLPIIK